MFPMKEPVTEFILEAPAGLVGIRAECKDGKVTQVTFKNVPAFAVHLDIKVEVPQLGTVTVDVAWGGMFYVIADANQFGLQLTPDEGRDITRISEMVKAATQEQYPVVHPENPEITGPTIAQLSAPATNPKAHRKNVVTVSTGKLDWNKPSTWTGVIDRSPCGTGTCAKMAALYARGQLGLNQDFYHEGILGTLFTGRLVEEGFKALSTDQLNVPARSQVTAPKGILLSMPAYMPNKHISVKLVTVFHENHSLNIPGHQAIIPLLDSETGTPIAIIDGEYITALRTAAGAILSIKLLDGKDIKSVAII